MKALKSFYQIESERAVSFFRVYEGIDVLHQQVEKCILTDGCQSVADQGRAIAAARESA